jgi:predicted O-linked N-acetylglucosamine transferase (SPINDLY family)
LKPDYAEAHNNLGIVLNEQGRLDEAIASYGRALALKPDYAEAHSNRGNALKDQGRLDEAVADFRQALTLQPNFTDAHSNLLFSLNYLPSQTAAHYLNEARRYGRQATTQVGTPFSDWRCPVRPERLRVGMVSGDFRNHPVGYFLENVLADVNQDKIELIAYPTNRREDELTARIHPHFVAWKLLAGLDDETAARLIHDDGPHVLLDLSGHTRSNRLPVFTWKPAPVQATWLGYVASTGVAEIDYLLADPVAVPEAHREHFSEKIWYLPDTRFCFSPPATGNDFPSTPLPALRNGYLTFGCFQNLAKINNEVLAVWGRIFQRLPRARLRLQNRLFNSPAILEQLQGRLARHGIAPGSTMFEKKVPRLEYLAAHDQIDIILDTFPFPGGTTTCEALWMGVPTVTLAGNTMVARQGASLLACAGLADWIAVDAEDYVDKALTHAADLEQLARLRTGLRRQVLASPLFDGPRFARNFEAALWGMWRGFKPLD